MPPRRAASAPASPSSPAFPSGLYGKYKQATNFFLDWLLRARSVGIGAAGNVSKKSELKTGVAVAAYEKIVTAIAREPTALSPALLQHWQRALAACETAITLRARVALFFPTSNTSATATDSHAYFLERLRSWLETLKQAEIPVASTAKSQVDSDEKPLDFSNYYAILELPDDYFPASASDREPVGERASAKSSAVDPEKLFNGAFENDLNVELSFLFMELEELSEAVYNTFLDVKGQKKTLVEASAVAKVAIDCAESVIAKLQLRFPSIRTGHDMMIMIQDRIPFDQLHDLLTSLSTAWASNETPSQTPKSQYVAGTIIADIMWVSRALESFVARPFAANANVHIPEDLLGETYSEERTPHYCAPNMIATPSFWMQQLPLLYNTLSMNRNLGIKQDTTTFSGWFLDQVDQLFTTRKVSIHFVFITICWIRSVSALQGEGGLGRTISLSIMHRWDLEERLRASIAHREVLRAHPPLDKHMRSVLGDIQKLNKDNAILRANPLLAGFVLLDCQLRFLDIGAETLRITTRFRAFGHIYNALRDRLLLEAIPFIEEILHVYERTVFLPSRTAAVHGSYTRTYFVSSDMTDASVDAMLGRRPPPSNHLARRVRDVCRLPDLSRVFRLLKQKDFSVLQTASATASWRTLVGAVSDLCAKELFGSRVLSRDMLKLSDDITDIFGELCDVLGRRDDANEILDDGIPHMTHQEVVNSVLEDVVAMPLLPFLDSLNHDGSTRVGADAADILQLDGVEGVLHALGGIGAIEAYCHRAARSISKRFGQRKASDIEATYFTFPAVPEWSLLEFGDASLHKEPQGGKTSDNFCALMEMMERSNGPLGLKDLKKFKRLIKLDPAILDVGAFDDSTSEMCTLLHHAAAGPARDLRLVEWLVQMGALHHQPLHCRHPPPPEVVASNGMDVSHLFNGLAVHCAAKAGLVDMVRLLLEADHMRDLNTVTFHTRESLAHISVKHGHRELCDLLIEMGANFRQQDVAGKHVYDLTADVSWKKLLVMVAVEQRREEEKIRARKNPTAEVHRIAEASADKFRKELASQREAERVQAQTSATRGGRVAVNSGSIALVDSRAALLASLPSTTQAEVQAGASSGKSKKKKKKKEPTGDKAVPPVASMMQQLLVGTDTRSGTSSKPDAENDNPGQGANDDIDTLGRALDVLKEGSMASSAERATSAKQALDVVDTLRGHVLYLSTARAKHDVMAAMRVEVGLEASRAVFLLNKFHRQLPEPQHRPRAEMWKVRADEATLSPWEKLVKRAGPPFDFDDYLAFALPTAEVLADCGRLPQAKEILELVERRLLKMKQRPPMFRKCIESYVIARRKAGIEPVGGSTPEARRVFEWYSNNFTGREGINALTQIDQLYGFQWYFKLKLVDDDCPELASFLNWLYSLDNPEVVTVVLVDGYIVSGADTRDDIVRLLRVVWEMARESGLQFDQQKSVFEETKLSLVGFEFTATGIVREKRN